MNLLLTSHVYNYCKPVLFKHFFSSPNIVTIHTLGTANINAYFQDNGLPGYFPGFEPPNQRNNKAAETSGFTVATFLI